MHMFLWQQPPRGDDRKNPLRVAGMVPMPSELIAPFCARFGIERLYQGFGQSEALTVLRRIDGLRSWKAGALGEPCAGIQVRLLGEDGCDVAVGEIGEFAVRTDEPHLIFEGYFRDADATAAASIDGWYRMGDLGRKNADGDFFFVDRKKDAVRYKGRNISTMEVESVVRRHPDVLAVAAFGIPCAELASEHELKCDVILREGSTLSEAELARFINDNAPYFFVPRYIEFVPDLPYTPTNKIQKFHLRAKGIGPHTWDRSAADFQVVK
jgi:crotonobetaine/carnitine-CoA ligase